jgi:hypothetical protein
VPDSSDYYCLGCDKGAVEMRGRSYDDWRKNFCTVECAARWAAVQTQSYFPCEQCGHIENGDDFCEDCAGEHCGQHDECECEGDDE